MLHVFILLSEFFTYGIVWKVRIQLEVSLHLPVFLLLNLNARCPYPWTSDRRHTTFSSYDDIPRYLPYLHNLFEVRILLNAKTFEGERVPF